MRPIPLDMHWAIEPTYFDRMQRFPVAQLVAQMPDAARELDDFPLPMQVKGSVAVIRIEGVITKNPSIFSMFFGGASSVLIRRSVEQAGTDPDVKTIVLFVDSPGGSVDGLAEAADAIFKVREQKTIVAQVSGLAASAAYYLASQAHRIVAGRMDLIGSIGTRLMLYDYSKLFEEEGVKAVPIDTGKFKSAGAMGTEITEEQQADFQRIVDQYFADFKAVVMRGRRMSDKRLSELADGRLFTATEAKENGLIDGIADADTTLLKLAATEKRARRTRQMRADLAIATAGL